MTTGERIEKLHELKALLECMRAGSEGGIYAPLYSFQIELMRQDAHKMMVALFPGEQQVSEEASR